MTFLEWLGEKQNQDFVLLLAVLFFVFAGPLMVVIRKNKNDLDDE